MTDDTETVFEIVLAAVLEPGTTHDRLLKRLVERLGTRRPLAVIRALLGAEGALRETFNGSSEASREIALARHAVRTLTVLADRAEAAAEPGAGPARLADLDL